jgi:UDP-N-acetylglucosamine--N-acetylmuramyl-(pentapeptide) pyrophosphoryl-undecaprenol N-acetylglucosamine transferase
MSGGDAPVVAFTGGGTGGHIYPGLAVAEELMASATLKLVWIGNESGMDRAIVERAGIEFVGIPSGKFRRDLSLRNVSDTFRILAGFFAARSALKRLKPALLFSKGGFVSVPPCFAAASLGIPVFAHESDTTPGLATRLNSRAAEMIFVAYDSTAGHFSARTREKVVRSGNPVRRAMLSGDADRGRAFLGFGADKPLVLFLGGSQGARQVNELAASCRESLRGRCRIAIQTGEANMPDAGRADPCYRAFPYLHGELPDVMAAADIVVGRSGAGTIWESAALGKPMVLIPLSGASTRGDQVVNAKLFESLGAAVCLTGADATGEKLAATLSELLRDDGKRGIMGKAALALCGPPAATAIAKRILERIGMKGEE